MQSWEGGRTSGWLRSGEQCLAEGIKERNVESEIAQSQKSSALTPVPEVQDDSRCP